MRPTKVQKVYDHLQEAWVYPDEVIDIFKERDIEKGWRGRPIGITQVDDPDKEYYDE